MSFFHLDINFSLVSSGNDAKDASNYSPARVPVAITVGAIDNNDVIASFSNFGTPLAVFAPGVDILSAWIGNPEATNVLSGTSMVRCFEFHISAAFSIVPFRLPLTLLVFLPMFLANMARFPLQF